MHVEEVSSAYNSETRSRSDKRGRYVIPLYYSSSHYKKVTSALSYSSVDISENRNFLIAIIKHESEVDFIKDILQTEIRRPLELSVVI